MNKKVNNKTVANYKLRKQIYEHVMNNVVAQLNEGEVNELFGWSNGVAKPERAITADYIASASQDELAETLAAWFNYWGDNAKDSLDKALSTAIVPCLEACKSGEEKSKKLLLGVTLAVKKSLSNSIESTKNSAKALPRQIVMGIALCIKLAANGITAAKQTALVLYQTVVKFVKNTYDSCAEKIEKGIDTIKDKLNILCKVSLAIFSLVSNKVTGAVETCGEWVKEVINAAKEKATLALLIVRSWFALKINAAKEYLTTLGNDVKNKIVEGYNAIDKGIRKAWNKIAEKVIEWCDNVRITVGKLADKVSETITAAGDTIVAGKDKVIVSGIGKAVKMLSKNYSEDDVVALVRKAYNEGLSFNADGSCVINECYYTNTHLNRI